MIIIQSRSILCVKREGRGWVGTITGWVGFRGRLRSRALIVLYSWLLFFVELDKPELILYEFVLLMLYKKKKYEDEKKIFINMEMC